MPARWRSVLRSEFDALSSSVGSGSLQQPVSVDMSSTETILTTFPLGHGWTGNGVGVGSDQGDFVNGDRSLQIITSGAGTDSIWSKTGLAAVNLSGKNVKITLKLAGGGARLPYIKLRVASGAIATDYAEAVIFDQSAANAAINSGQWTAQTVPPSAFVTTGVVDMAAITSAQLILKDDTTGQGRVLFNAIVGLTRPAQGVVSVCFDDGLASVYTLALKRLSQYRMPASAYIICDQVDSGTSVDARGIMSTANLREMRDQHGWDIQFHAGFLANHNLASGLASLSDADLDADLRYGINWLHQRGFRADHIAYPKGLTGGTVLDRSKQYFRAGRGTLYGPDTYLPRDLFNLRGTSVKGLTETVVNLKALVDKAIADRSWLILTFHNITGGAPGADTDFKQTDFNSVIDYIASSGVKVRTVGDQLKQLAP